MNPYYNIDLDILTEREMAIYQIGHNIGGIRAIVETGQYHISVDELHDLGNNCINTIMEIQSKHNIPLVSKI